MTDVNDPNAAPSASGTEATPPVYSPPPAAASVPVGSPSPSYAPPPAPAQAPVYAQQPAYGQTYAPPARWNVLGIISFATALLGISIVGIVLGHISLSQIKRTGEQGRVFAILGLVLGYLGILAAVVFLIIFIPLFFLGISQSGTTY